MKYYLWFTYYSYNFFKIGGPDYKVQPAPWTVVCTFVVETHDDTIAYFEGKKK